MLNLNIFSTFFSGAGGARAGTGGDSAAAGRTAVAKQAAAAELVAMEHAAVVE